MSDDKMNRGEPIFELALSLMRLVCISGDFITSLISVLSLSMMLAGVPAGARIPDQNVACSLGNPHSVVVGTVGNCEQRISSATASALSFPAST